MNRHHFKAVCHGETEQIFITKIVEYVKNMYFWRLGTENQIHLELLAPYQYNEKVKKAQSQTQTTNLSKNIIMGLAANKELKEQLTKNTITILILIDINEEDENQEVSLKIQNNDFTLEYLFKEQIKPNLRGVLEKYKLNIKIESFWSDQGIEDAIAEIIEAGYQNELIEKNKYEKYQKNKVEYKRKKIILMQKTVDSAIEILDKANKHNIDLKLKKSNFQQLIKILVSNELIPEIYT